MYTAVIFYYEQSPSETALLVQSVNRDQWYSNIKSAEYLCEIKAGKTYWGIGQSGGREKQREWIKREREVALVERGNGMSRNDCW